MTTREDVLQAMGLAFRTAFALQEDDTVVASDSNVRPPLPYLTFEIATWSGIDDALSTWTTYADDGAGTCTQTTCAEGEATVEVIGYGPGSLDWIERFYARTLRQAEVQSVLSAAGLVCTAATPVVNLNTPNNSQIEYRAIASFTVTFIDTDGPYAVVEPDEVVVTSDHASPSGPSPLTLSTVVDPDNPVTC